MDDERPGGRHHFGTQLSAATRQYASNAKVMQFHEFRISRFKNPAPVSIASFFPKTVGEPLLPRISNYSRIAGKSLSQEAPASSRPPTSGETRVD